MAISVTCSGRACGGGGGVGVRGGAPDLAKRLPCGDAEKVRKAVHDFWLVRRLQRSLLHESEEEVPILEPPIPILPHDVLDLSTCGGAGCGPRSMRATDLPHAVGRHAVATRSRDALQTTATSFAAPLWTRTVTVLRGIWWSTPSAFFWSSRTARGWAGALCGKCRPFS